MILCFTDSHRKQIATCIFTNIEEKEELIKSILDSQEYGKSVAHIYETLNPQTEDLSRKLCDNPNPNFVERFNIVSAPLCSVDIDEHSSIDRVRQLLIDYNIHSSFQMSKRGYHIIIDVENLVFLQILLKNNGVYYDTVTGWKAVDDVEVDGFIPHTIENWT